MIDTNWRIGIVHSLYYKEDVDALVQGAQTYLQERGLTNITLHPVLGSFEVPLVGAALAEEEAVDALIGFGIILQGETAHADHLAREVARGMMDVQLNYGIPFAYEVLHVHSLEQVRERSVGVANKGAEAASAVLHSLAQLKSIRS